MRFTRKTVIFVMLVLVITLSVLLVVACTPSVGGSTSKDKKEAVILPTARISLVPVSNGLPSDDAGGKLICLDAIKDRPELFDIVIKINNPDNYEILSVKYYIETTKSGIVSKAEYNISSEGFGRQSDNKTVYIKDVDVDATSGDAKVVFEEIKYLFKNQNRLIAGISGTEFTVKIAPEFKLTMDMTECGSDAKQEKNKYLDKCKLIGDNVMNASSKNGYVFDGWYTEPNGGGERYSSLDQYSFYTDMTFYAHYEMSITYTVSTSEEGDYIVVTGLTKAGEDTRFPIVIPSEIDGITVREVGSTAFAGKGSGHCFELPNTIRVIGDYAFNKCTDLQINLGSVKEIGQFAFADCGKIVLGSGEALSLVRVSELPTSLTKIGNYAFRKCGWDASVINPYRDGYFKSSLTLMVPATVKHIGDGAFSESLFEAVYFQKGVTTTYLGKSLFEGSKALKKLYTSFDFKATGMGHVDVGTDDGLEEITDRMFYNCVSLSAKSGAESVRLAEGLKRVGEKAFAASDKGMVDFTYLRLPDSLEEIGVEAFANTGLTDVRFGEGSKLRVLGKWCFENSKFTEITIYSLTEYREAPFWGNTNLERINILTDNVPRYYAPTALDLGVGLARDSKYFVKESMLNRFRNDSGWNPKSSAYVDEWYYKPVDYICCYDYITPIENGVSYCFEPIDENGVYDKNSNIAKITACFGKRADVTVPSSIIVKSKEYTVVSVGKYFVCENLQKISLPSTLTRIEEYAFYGCDKLSDLVWVNDGTTVNLTAIEEDPLELSYIGDYAFYATALVRFCSNSKLREIGTGAFKYCTKLATIVLNKGRALTVGISAFSQCGGDVNAGTTLAIGNKVEYVGRYAFFENINLKVVYVNLVYVPQAPGGGYLYDCPFNGCNALEAVYVFDIDALSEYEDGTFKSVKNKDGTNNTYSTIKKADQVTSAYVYSQKTWTEAVKNL